MNTVKSDIDDLTRAGKELRLSFQIGAIAKVDLRQYIYTNQGWKFDRIIHAGCKMQHVDIRDNR